MDPELTVIVTNILTPHDVSILILITFFCLQVEDLGPQTLMYLIPPVNLKELAYTPFDSIRASECPPALSPILSDLVIFLVRDGYKQASRKLVTTLRSISTVNGVARLLDTLEIHCVKNSYRDMLTEDKKALFKRQLTKGSLLGSYVSRCITKHKIQNFEDSEKLWRGLQSYLQEFEENIEIGGLIGNELPKLDPLMSFVLENEDDGVSGLEDFRDAGVYERYSELMKIENGTLLMISKDHFQAMVTEESERMVRGNKRLRQHMRQIIESMSLEDMSRFPSVHILKGMEDLTEQRYETFLSSLYRYFDYMLGQNSEPNFHLSLLSLASFHSHFNESEAAVKTFEEAMSVARENKDTETLHLILMWVFEFIDKYPNLAKRFHVTAMQIVNNLKTCPGDQSPLVFEMGYRYETLWEMHNTGSVSRILEATFKSTLLAVQTISNSLQFSLLAAHNANVWKYLGSSALSNLYQSISAQGLNKPKDQTIQDYIAEELDSSRDVATELNTPHLNYRQRRDLEERRVEQLIEVGDSDEAMKLVNAIIHSCQNDHTDIENELRFNLIKCRIMIRCGLEVRCLSILIKIIDCATVVENGYLLAQCLLLLSKVLICIDKAKECSGLLMATMHNILRFADNEYQHLVVELYFKSRKQILK
ncbi:LADA_0C06546g1_1 [Lachancea dasiensis]|uniref:Anaphase-promoting complex subunit 5 n=1 Tax=Lachancea dasiensis TaxID=1072105 RepID=A0A1G4IZ94_9SACH|nr:LADA_0C06546g1_1 [Lachancea dasiensis]